MITPTSFSTGESCSIRRLRACIVGLACIPLVTACGREPRTEEISAAAKALTVMGPDGTPRMFAADQDSSGSRFCFQSADSTLPVGAPVSVIHTVFPQYAVDGRLGRRSKSPCFPAPVVSIDSMEYVVDAPDDTLGRRGVPILVLGRLPTVQMRGDTVMLAVEPGQKSWRFRTCASEEGVHATAWSGVPLSSPRRWHAYYYLGYDVEPDCTPADYAADSAAAKH